MDQVIDQETKKFRETLYRTMERENKTRHASKILLRYCSTCLALWQRVMDVDEQGRKQITGS